MPDFFLKLLFIIEIIIFLKKKERKQYEKYI